MRRRSIWRCWRSSVPCWLLSACCWRWTVSTSCRASAALSGSAALDFAALAVPNCPWALTTTGWAVPLTVLPLIPAMTVRV